MYLFGGVVEAARAFIRRSAAEVEHAARHRGTFPRRSRAGALECHDPAPAPAAPRAPQQPATPSPTTTTSVVAVKVTAGGDGIERVHGASLSGAAAGVRNHRGRGLRIDVRRHGEVCATDACRDDEQRRQRGGTEMPRYPREELLAAFEQEATRRVTPRRAPATGTSGPRCDVHGGCALLSSTPTADAAARRSDWITKVRWRRSRDDLPQDWWVLDEERGGGGLPVPEPVPEPFQADGTPFQFPNWTRASSTAATACGRPRRTSTTRRATRRACSRVARRG